MATFRNNEKIEKEHNNLVLCIINLTWWKFILENKHQRNTASENH